MQTVALSVGDLNWIVATLGGGVLWQATVAAGGNEQWDLSNAPVACEKSERLYLTIDGDGATATVGWMGYYTGEAA